MDRSCYYLCEDLDRILFGIIDEYFEKKEPCLADINIPEKPIEDEYSKFDLKINI